MGQYMTTPWATEDDSPFSLKRNGYENRRQLHPSELESFLKPLYKSMFKEIGYVSAAKMDPNAVSKLLQSMKQKADQTGLDYVNNSISANGFSLGLSLACLCYDDHPIQIQTYIGIYTWLAVLIDDRIGEMAGEVEGYQRRFFSGEQQPTPLLRAAAALMKETWSHWDPLLANLIVTSTVDGVTSNLLDTRAEFHDLITTRAGTAFPYFFRNMSGLTTAYACFTYPQNFQPDLGMFLEAIPDMALYINIVNDVLSFYKEEAVGEVQNYIHNRARCENKNPLRVLKEVKGETVACVRRIRSMLDGRDRYLEAWERQVMGMIAMHKVNPRYRLSELGLGEDHPVG